MTAEVSPSLKFCKVEKKIDKKGGDNQIEQSHEETSLKEMGFKLLELITSNRADEEQVRTIPTFVMNLFSGPVKPPDKPSSGFY
jgi:hypothetical protein